MRSRNALEAYGPTVDVAAERAETVDRVTVHGGRREQLPEAMWRVFLETVLLMFSTLSCVPWSALLNIIQGYLGHTVYYVRCS